MSKFEGFEHRVPIEHDNPSIVCNDSICKKCKLCVKACTVDAGVYPLYDLEKNGDHAVCINCGQCVISCPFNPYLLCVIYATAPHSLFFIK